jgi:sugar/nucleoside kinase (ribokinase family)
MRQLSPDPLSLSAQALGAGTSLLVVTLGPKGAAYVAAQGFDGWAADGRTVGRSDGQVVAQTARSRSQTLAADPSAPSPSGYPTATTDRLTVRPSDRPIRTARIPAARVDALDPTGCGDVFGAAAYARLLAGDGVEPALQHATLLAARNAALRGAAGLGRHLRGELLVP